MITLAVTPLVRLADGEWKSRLNASQAKKTKHKVGRAIDK